MSPHIAAGVLTTISLTLLACATSSGRSYLTLKSSNVAMIAEYPYGIGLITDSYGHYVTDSEHLLGMAKCDDHQHRLKYVMACAGMITFASGVAVLAHAIAASSGSKTASLASVALQGFTFLFGTTALGLGANAYDNGFWCNPIGKSPFKLWLKELFDLNFALPFLIVVILFALANVGILVGGGALKGPEEPKVVAAEPADEA
eukprot:Rhum_TRINITY_DN14679_c15_g1::Rhum_TRINITY_DN14679_c15_g1_i1::g.110382::m.110382